MKKTILAMIISPILILGCKTEDKNSNGGNSGSGGEGNSSSEIIKPDIEGEFGIWTTEFPESLREEEAISISSSRNGIFEIKYKNYKDIVSEGMKSYSTIIKMEKNEEGIYESDLELGNGYLYGKHHSGMVKDAHITIENISKNQIKVNFTGVAPNGYEINISDHIMYLSVTREAGREAQFIELDRELITLETDYFEYLGNGKIYVEDSDIGCNYTAEVTPSGYTILSGTPYAFAEDYEPWAFDFVINAEDTNCEILENQAGVLNIYYGMGFPLSYDEIHIRTAFKDYKMEGVMVSYGMYRPEEYAR
tara:strand:+ start:604 stop:1524 length:921 start_codon:yes stop_codon:yes gene_type:complete